MVKSRAILHGIGQKFQTAWTIRIIAFKQNSGILGTPGEYGTKQTPLWHFMELVPQAKVGTENADNSK